MPKKSALAQIPQPIRGLFLLIAAVFLGTSLLSYSTLDASKNWLGLVGHVLGWGIFYLFGLASFLLPSYLGWLGWRLFRKKEILRPQLTALYFFVTLISLCFLLAMVAHALPKFSTLFEKWVYSNYYPDKAYFDPVKLRHYLGGVPLHHLYVDTTFNFYRCLGGLGSFLFFALLFCSSAVLLTNFPILALIGKLTAPRKQKRVKIPSAKILPFNQEEEAKAVQFVREDPLKRTTKIHFPEKKTISPAAPVIEKWESDSSYTLPSCALLTEVKPVDQSALKNDLKRQAQILEETLMSFAIEAKVGEIHCGPTITSFEVHPAVGVKVQKIKTLENDIALNLQAKTIRIIAPIPGKAAVGIEVPNPQPQEVSFRELTENYRSLSKKGYIPLLLGKVVNGDDVWSDLTKMPHLIIAGATGSGKSVCINTIVMSIVMNARPDEIKLLMIDPKKVELTAYTQLPHMIAPVITEPAAACAALQWLVREMERRYEIFRQLGIRNIQGFNARKINKELETSLDLEIPLKMPFIVLLIDELADLMMASSSDIETPIARIAQMARAVGIHMIVATQRPSREVITGLIKANFPCRIAFKVSSRVNSQIIIDENGAEALLGSGDMLFLPPGSSTLTRTQGAFIRDDDINKVIEHCCRQAPTHYWIPSFATYRDAVGGDEATGMVSTDALYEEAKKLVFETGNASTTFLQRKLKIGYARAASLMDQLEANQVIGPLDGAKPRRIFYPERHDMDDKE